MYNVCHILYFSACSITCHFPVHSVKKANIFKTWHLYQKPKIQYRCLKNQTCTGDPSIQRVLQWPRIIVYVHVYMRIGMCIERSLCCRWWFQFDIFKWSNIIVRLFVSRCLFVSLTCTWSRSRGWRASQFKCRSMYYCRSN